MAASMRNMFSNSKKYILWCANDHVDFRIPEIKSIASMFNLKINFSEKNLDEPYIIAEMNSEGDVRKLMSRSMIVRSAYEFWGTGISYNQLHENLKLLPQEFVKPYRAVDKSFKVRVESFGKKLNKEYKLKRINELDFLKFEGPVDLNNADNTFHLLEYYYGSNPNLAPENPSVVFFGRLICNGQRSKISELSLKSRKFIGNTSMEAGLSLIMANQACVKKNSLVLDPFVGSGSLLVAAAQCGAYVLGTDIDYLTLHGLAKPTRYNEQKRAPDESILSNLRQYQLESHYLDVVVADASKSMWKTSWKFDAIITDPPYGIREATEKIGTRKQHKIKSEQLLGHIPSKVEYNLSALLADLLNFAAEYLNINGRLVFWLPVFKEDYSEKCIPAHPSLKLISNSEQELTAHSSRRLITMEKTCELDLGEAIVHENADSFRFKYFQAVKQRMTENSKTTSQELTR